MVQVESCHTPDPCPFILKYPYAWQEKCHFYIETEYCPGKDLDAWTRRYSRKVVGDWLSESDIWLLLAQMCQGEAAGRPRVQDCTGHTWNLELDPLLSSISHSV